MCWVNEICWFLFVGRLFHNGDAFVGGFCSGDGDLQHASYLSDILVRCAVGGGGVCALVAGDEVFAFYLRCSLEVGKVQYEAMPIVFSCQGGVAKRFFSFALPEFKRVWLSSLRLV